ncbi:hypothetical protein [Thioalkalivibrio nitratireducens]|uniref:hypothetical protein n=1 Tax=Thioalkalivibrio nitratireducens TaxID=186931 RepID=UPI0012EE9BF2|nr:hypothetical protein [Thioalkalivibrio nitratireducens]
MVKHALLWLVTVGFFAWLLPALAQPSGSGVERLNPWDFECTSGVNCCEVVRTNTHPYRYAMVCDPNLPSATHPIRVFGPKRGRAIAGWMANAQIPRWEGEALPGYPYDPPPACDPRCETGETCCAIGRFPDHREQEVGRWAMWGRAYDGHVPATRALQQIGRDIILENVSFEYCHAWWNENLVEQGLASRITDPTPRGAIPCGPEDLRSTWGDPDDPPDPVPPSRAACEEKVCPVCRETISLLGVRMAHPECERCIQENEARILACMEGKPGTKPVPQLLQINEMPNAFFGNWYDMKAGYRVHRFVIREESFRTGNRNWQYSSIRLLENDVFDVTITRRSESRRYIFRNITQSSMKYRIFEDPEWTEATR